MANQTGRPQGHATIHRIGPQSPYIVGACPCGRPGRGANPRPGKDSLLGKAQEFDGATLQVIKVHCHDNEQANGYLQVEWVDAKQVASVGKQSHDDCSQNGTNGTALCSRQAGAADDCTGNGLQLVPGSCRGYTCTKSRSS